ncbi:uncharacterized protein SB:CB1058 [Latimeria chalumnae]|uniref:uncharacterized protein SB:CB1058 n=1 Tax=Latimeria chalumnae TaxID=7897 RepID=UPI00313AC12D
MTSGKTPKRSKRSRASFRQAKPPSALSFLDTSNGFYNRLEEIDYPMEIFGSGEKSEEPEDNSRDSFWSQSAGEAFDDKGRSPLIADADSKEGSEKKNKRKKSIRRSLRYSKKKPAVPSASVGPAAGEASDAADSVAHGEETQVVHFSILDDSQVLIDREQEKKEEGRGPRYQKPTKMKQYRESIDRAFRRGWEAFISNLYSVTLSQAMASSTDPPLVKAC